jgi:hypothetical protein
MSGQDGAGDGAVSGGDQQRPYRWDLLEGTGDAEQVRQQEMVATGLAMPATDQVLTGVDGLVVVAVVDCDLAECCDEECEPNTPSSE